jgi:hypothetical protein
MIEGRRFSVGDAELRCSPHPLFFKRASQAAVPTRCSFTMKSYMSSAERGWLIK